MIDFYVTAEFHILFVDHWLRLPDSFASFFYFEIDFLVEKSANEFNYKDYGLALSNIEKGMSSAKAICDEEHERIYSKQNLFSLRYG